MVCKGNVKIREIMDMMTRTAKRNYTSEEGETHTW